MFACRLNLLSGTFWFKMIFIKNITLFPWKKLFCFLGDLLSVDIFLNKYWIITPQWDITLIFDTS